MCDSIIISSWSCSSFFSRVQRLHDLLLGNLSLHNGSRAVWGHASNPAFWFLPVCWSWEKHIQYVYKRQPKEHPEALRVINAHLWFLEAAPNPHAHTPTEWHGKCNLWEIPQWTSHTGVWIQNWDDWHQVFSEVIFVSEWLAFTFTQIQLCLHCNYVNHFTFRLGWALTSDPTDPLTLTGIGPLIFWCSSVWLLGFFLLPVETRTSQQDSTKDVLETWNYILQLTCCDLFKCYR